MQLQLSTSFTALDLAPFVKMKVKSSAAMCINWSRCPGRFPGQSTQRLEEKDHSQKPGENIIHIHTTYTLEASLTFHARNVCQCAPCPKFGFLCCITLDKKFAFYVHCT